MIVIRCAIIVRHVKDQHIVTRTASDKITSTTANYSIITVVTVQAIIAAYEDEGFANLCETLTDLDEGLQEWRYRHVMMVRRTIGTKAGTGGSDGAAYLATTLFHPAFPDLWAIRTAF